MDIREAVRTFGTGAGQAGRRIDAEILGASCRARAIVEEAEEEASRIRERARDQVEDARRTAMEEARGEVAARAAGELVRAALERDRILAACAPEVVSLALDVASRILERDVRPGADAVDLARRAIATLRTRAVVTLRVSPADLLAVRAASASDGPWHGRVRVQVDEELAPGEVVAEAGGAWVDGRFPARLAQVRRALEEVLE